MERRDPNKGAHLPAEGREGSLQFEENTSPSYTPLPQSRVTGIDWRAVPACSPHLLEFRLQHRDMLLFLRRQLLA